MTWLVGIQQSDKSLFQSREKVQTEKIIPSAAISPSSSLRTSVPSQSLLPDALYPDYPYAPCPELVLNLSCLPSFCQIGLVLPFAGRFVSSGRKVLFSPSCHFHSFATRRSLLCRNLRHIEEAVILTACVDTVTTHVVRSR